MRSLVVVRCCLIVCLVSQIGPRIRISDNGRHDADEVQLFHRPLSRRLDRCDRMIQNEGNDSRKLFTLTIALCR